MRGAREMGVGMLKIFLRLSGVIGGVIGLMWMGGALITRAPTPEVAPIVADAYAVADTYACPTRDGIVSYLNNGLSEETRPCGPVAWSEVEDFASLGSFVMPYADIFDEFGDGTLRDTFVEVYHLKYEGVELFAIREMFDYHAFDKGPVGLKPGVHYFAWKDSPVNASTVPRV